MSGDGLEVLWEQEAASSNLAIPTTNTQISDHDPRRHGTERSL